MAEERAVSLGDHWKPSVASRLLNSRFLRGTRLARAAIPPTYVNLEPVPRVVPGASASLTVISANLWHDIPRQRDQEARLEAFARLVEDEAADVLLLQEVGRRSALRVDVWLAERMGFAFAYGRANGLAEATGLEEGLAIFSRYPLRDPFMVPLSNPLETWRRIALGVVVRCPWGEMLAVSTHHSLRRGRNRRQPERLRVSVEARAGDCPAIVGGDFNAAETSSPIRALAGVWADCYRAVNPVGDAPTHELSGPFGLYERRDRLDYVFLRSGAPGLSITEVRHIATSPLAFSDHRAVLVRFRPMDG